ncbi:MAG: DUF3307 domain-containing protein [Gilvibacter sp.]
MTDNLLIALQLILAHVLTDFVFQTKKGIAQKRAKKARSGYLYVHALLAGVLTYLLLQQWTQFLVPAMVMVTHYLIDLWKLHQGQDNLRNFLIDQFAHLLVLLAAWWYLTHTFDQVLPTLQSWITDANILALLIGYIMVIYPVGFVIGKATQKWQSEIAEDEALSSLARAGRTIGIFERILVVTFILTGNFSAIGFLIGAKSILRFSDAKKTSARKQTEYVLIGTLMSFALSIIIGSLMRILIF